MKTNHFLFYIVFSLIQFNLYSQTCIVQSPDQTSEFKITAGDKIEYEVLYKGTYILDNSTFGLQFTHSKYFF